MLSMFNSTLVSVILPDIGSSLAASANELQWIATIYTLCYACFLIPGGELGNRIGKRRTFLIGAAAFIGASLICALAPDIAVLLAGRALQGVGAAIILPQTLSILVSQYPEPAARARAVGIWAGVSSLGLAAGPVLGGIIVHGSSWRWGFGLSIVLAVLAFLLAAIVVPKPSARVASHPSGPRVDLAGAALSVVTLAALTLGLIESSSLGWTHPVILAAGALFVVGVVVFLKLEQALGRGRAKPIMPLELWRIRAFIAANVGGVIYFFAFFGVLFYFSLELQVERGFTALVTGLAFLPMSLAMAVIGPVAGRLSARIGPGRVLTIGLVVSAVGCALLTFLPADATLIDLEWRLLIVGLGFGFVSSPMSNLAVSSVPVAQANTASAVHNMCRQIGSTLGVAALGVVVAAGSEFSVGLAYAMALTAVLLLGVGALVWRNTRRP